MGTTQQAWLDGQMTASKATWQILGNQTVMGRVLLPASVLRPT
jgi:alkaline phosphatase D